MELLAEPERVLLLDSPQGGNETILLVDDEQPIRDLIQKSLAQLGYTVKTASDTQSALAIYRQELDHIDLVILDLIMPGLSGKHCLEEILKMNPKAKVLISSGYCDVPHIKEMLAGGAKRFLSKPYQLHELFQVIRNVIESK
jgi:DNA-binding NtrC family response regulator